jgi:hypothetical protein
MLNLPQLCNRIWNGLASRDNQAVATALDNLRRLFHDIERDSTDIGKAQDALNMLYRFSDRRSDASFYRDFSANITKGILEWNWSEENWPRVEGACNSTSH